ncbi:uncharacterized protein CDAR_616751 [Caerostris darwini]|uniref:Uncharacterized protein n=1 Tax=Caerostris darwini TaxID=1538125 RepID=A0AAV4V408_9ARAC|nr:uncharacterized protein CDAR_616751 [Caerostris darwini]
MEECIRNIYNVSAWQATCPSILLHLRNAVLFTTETMMSYQRVPKKFTTEAIYMLSAILVFVVLAAAGSLVTFYEFFCNSNRKGNQSVDGHNIDSFKNGKKTEPANKSPESSGNTAPSHLKSFLKCFCISTNGKKILSVDSKEDQFGCIHGIRVFSNFWVTLFHISLAYTMALRNIEGIRPFMGTWITQFVMNGLFAVDAFFVLSGFLNGYIFSSDFDKNYGQISWFHFLSRGL